MMLQKNEHFVCVDLLAVATMMVVRKMNTTVKKHAGLAEKHKL